MSAAAITTSTSIQLNNKQRNFIGYALLFLLNLTVLNVVEEFWSWVSISSFTISILAVMVLQSGLLLAMKAEAKAAAYFKTKAGVWAKIGRGISSYILLVGGKFAVMGVIAVLFGDSVLFLGPYAGAISFIVLVAVILVAEGLVKKAVKKLAD